MPYAPYRTKCLLLAALSLVPGAARAIEPLDTFSVSLGGYVTRFDTRVRVDGEALGGTRIDLSKDLGLDADDMIGFASMTWRPFARHEVGVSYFGNTVDADHRLQRDIVFDDKVYAASATVHGHYGVDAVEAYYTWWGFLQEDWALGPRLGVTWYRIELGLELEADINGEPVADGTLDGFIDCSPSAHGVWDYLGGLLVCREAGAVVADGLGRELVTLDHADRRTPVAAATPQLLAEIVAARRTF